MYGHCFYTEDPKDEHSMEFLRQLVNENLDKSFTMISISKMPASELRRINLTQVPAIIVNVASKSTIYEGAKAFEWLDNTVRWRKETLSKQIDDNRVRLLKSNAEAMKNKDVEMGYSQMEMGGISDDFSYLITDHAQNKSFMQCGFEDFYKIPTFKSKSETKMSDSELKANQMNRERQTKMIQDETVGKLRDTLCTNMQRGFDY